MIRQVAIIAAAAVLGGCEKYSAAPTEWSAEQYIAEDNLTTQPQLPCFDNLGGNAYVPRQECAGPWHDDGSLLSRMRNGAETLNTSTGDQKRRRPTAF